jgi:hypothetical protein
MSMSTLELVHVHSFKCAGTTFSASLAANYLDEFRCIEPRSPRILGWDEISVSADAIGIKALSSHSLCIPKNVQRETIFVHLIREPSARWVSAWEHESGVQKKFIGTFKEYLESQTVNKNRQSKILLQDHANWNSELFVEDCEIADLLAHRPSVFLGVVERYEESMVVLEDLLKRNSVIVDLSFPTLLNKANKLKSYTDLEREIPASFVNIDRELLRLANIRLDLYISMIPNFQDLLRNFKARCKLSKENSKLFAHRVATDNWHFV